MTDLSRRQALFATGAAVTLLSAGGALAAVKAAAPPTNFDLSELFATPGAWTTERDAVVAALPGLTAAKGKLAQSPATLKATLQLTSDLNRRLGRLSTYANLAADQNLSDAPNQERRSLAVDLAGKVGEAGAWINPELLKLGPARLGELAADPGLAKFAFGLKDLQRQAAHVLDDEGEALMAAAIQPLSGPQAIRSQLVLSDMPWKDITLADGKTLRLDPQGYSAARASPVRDDRKRAFDQFFGTFKLYESTLGAALSAQVQGDIFVAKARHYPNALSSALAGNAIPEAMYRSLVAQTDAGLPVLHRYFDLRRRMLGLPDMAYYDIYPPVTKLDVKFDMATIRSTVLDAVAPLGPDYVALLGASTLKPWMSAFPAKGKVAGAYMDPGAYDVHPYLMLNLHDDYDGMTTFAHEWGHAMHSLLANKAQPYETSNYPTLLAEIASTLNEQLLVEHMVKAAKTKAEKLFYLAQICEQLRGTFFRQAMFGEFELAMHETAEKGEALSGARLSSIYLDLLHRYHGPAVKIEEVYGMEWAYPQHFYFNFYVYQYAASISAAVYFADQILSGKPGARETYLGVLKAGGSAYPVEILKSAGLDMTSAAPYQAVTAKLARTLDAMEALLAPG
jgi:oligoendopeptidase F